MINWTSPNGWYTITNEGCTPDTIRIDNNATCSSQFALLYSHNGSIAYDSPNLLPKYIKDKVVKLLNPCIGVMFTNMANTTPNIDLEDYFSGYKEYKYHYESFGGIKHISEIPKTYYNWTVQIYDIRRL